MKKKETLIAKLEKKFADMGLSPKASSLLLEQVSRSNTFRNTPQSLIEGYGRLFARKGLVRWAIYGGGSHTEMLLRNCRFSKITICAIIDKNTGKKEMQGIPVFRPHEIKQEGIDAILLSSACYETEMHQDILREDHLKEKPVIFLYNTSRNEHQLEQSLTMPKDARDFIQSINKRDGRKKVLFFLSQEFYSIARQVMALQSDKSDFDCYVLLLNASTSFNLGVPAKSTLHCHGNLLLLCEVLARVKVPLIHCYFSMMVNSLFVLAKSLFQGKILYETVDISSFFLPGNLLGDCFGHEKAILELESEKLVFGKSDYLLLQSERSRAFLNEGFSITAETAIFHPGPLPEFHVPINPDKCLSNGITVAYAGIVIPSSFSSDFWGDTKFMRVIKAFEKNRIQFSIYPNRAMGFESHYEDYQSLSDESEFFTFREGLQPNEIQKALSSYHFGAMLYDFSETKAGRKHLESVITTKFITYIEAGTPILISEEMASMAEIVEKHKLGIVLDQATLFGNSEEMRKKIISSNYREMLDALEEYRQAHHMSRNMQVVKEIYEKANSQAVPK